MDKYDALVQKLVAEDKGVWGMLWGNITAQGDIMYLYHMPVSRSHEAVTLVEYYTDDLKVVVTFKYSVEEMRQCPKYDLSVLPRDWAHVMKYSVFQRDNVNTPVCECVRG